MDRIINGKSDYWKHIGNGAIYRVDGQITCKNGDTDEVYVMYHAVDHSDISYCRSPENFLKSFVQVREPKPVFVDIVFSVILMLFVSVAIWCMSMSPFIETKNPTVKFEPVPFAIALITFFVGLYLCLQRKPFKE